MTQPEASTASPQPVRLEFDFGFLVRNLLLLCVAIELLLFSLDFHLNLASNGYTTSLRNLFNAAREDSLASWFSVAQTGLLALTLWALFAISRRTQVRTKQRGWMALALFFSYLAVDDAVVLHERLGSIVESAAAGLGVDRGVAAAFQAFPSYAWQVLLLPGLILAGGFTLLFLLRELHSPRAKLLTVVALACLAAAVGLDFAEGLDPAHALNPYGTLAASLDLDGIARSASPRSRYATVLHLSRTAEEGLEMFAITLLWVAALAQLGRMGRALDLRLHSAFDTPAVAPVRHRRIDAEVATRAA